MSTDAIDGTVLVPKSINNSQVVRQVDPRSSRELWRMLGLVLLLVGGLALYAWPGLELHRLAKTAAGLSQERERLVEENRKLRLEKATLEDLHRVETIATRQLGLSSPPPERQIVVERARSLPEDARLVRVKDDVPSSN